MNMHEPKALLFDCFGLFAPDPLVTFFLQRFGPDSLPLKDHFCEPGDLGDITIDQLYENMERELGVKKEEVEKHLDEVVHPDEKMIAFVQQLKTRHPCYLLSNCMPGMLERFFGKTTFFDCFTKQYRSYEIKHIKPYPDYFEYVLSDLGLKPEETLSIDDNPVNVAAAAKLGIEAIQFTGFEPFVQEMNRRGL